MSHFHHWSKARPKQLMAFIREGGHPAICGCDVCETLYAECREAAEKLLANQHYVDPREAERLETFLSNRPLRIYPRHVANEMQRGLKS